MESLEMAKHWFESKSPDLSEGSIYSPIASLTPLTPKHRETSEIPLVTKNDRTPFLTHADGSKEDEEFETFAKRDATFKRAIRVLKFFFRLLGFLLATYTLTAMSLTLSIYLRTAPVHRTVNLPTGTITRGPWHRDSKTWPTNLLLATSIISCASGVVVMATYLHSIKAANQASAWASKMTYTLFAAHVVVWIATAVAYRKGKDGSDLWGWSCTPEAKVELQPFFRQEVDFATLCSVQTASWAVSIIQIIVSLLNLVVYGAAFRRLQLKRYMSAQFSDRYQHDEDPWQKRVLPQGRKAGLGYVSEMVGLVG